MFRIFSSFRERRKEYNKRIESENRRKKEEFARSVNDYLKNVTKFQGSLEEFEKSIGEECEILGPSISLDFYIPPLQDHVEMYTKGVEAIVNYKPPFNTYSTYYPGTGLPVRRKSREPPISHI